MISGKLNLFAEDDLERLVAGTMRILQTTGIQVHSEYFLDGLAKKGADVDPATRCVRFPEWMIRELVEERQQTPAPAGRGSARLEREYRPGLGIIIAPFLHDYERRTRRHATRDDLVEITRWADVDIDQDRPVGQAVTMSEVDPRVEPIEAYALLLTHTSHPEPVAYTSEVVQIEYLLELATIRFGNQVFPTGANFMTSPLTLGDRAAHYLLAAIRWGRTEHGIGVMPICGGNAPMTVAGNVVISAAELLGAWMAIKAVQPEATLRGGACNGIIDMRRGVASFNAPEALLADLGVCELFRRRFGGGVGIAGGSDYIDARLTGLQSAYERTIVAMSIAAFTDRPFDFAASGTLDSGKLFSPVDFIIDRELGAGLWRLGQGVEVSDDTLALDTIEAVGIGEGKSYMETDHTLSHYRDTWFPKWLARGMWRGDEIEFSHEEMTRETAYQHYRECIARYTPPSLDEAALGEIRRIVRQARSDLLA